MKIFILIIICIFCVSIGFFLGARKIEKPSSGLEVSVLLDSRELYTLAKKYLLSNDDSAGLLQKDIKGAQIVRSIDVVKAAYPINKNYLELYTISPEKRRNYLETIFEKLDKKTMGYASISDVLFGTKLCNTFYDREQCIEQYDIIQSILLSKKIDIKNITLDMPKKVGIYAHENTLTESEYMTLIDGLLKQYLNIKE